MADVRVEVEGADRLAAALRKVPQQSQRYLQQAGRESFEYLLARGELAAYPPADEANSPPPPYYRRGMGMQYKTRNDGRSENYGKQWYVKPDGYTTIIGNSASYARYLTDARLQARRMAARGWRKAIDVVRAGLPQIKAIYSEWISKLLRDLGL